MENGKHNPARGYEAETERQDNRSKMWSGETISGCGSYSPENDTKEAGVIS